jgi:hypothetical protein
LGDRSASGFLDGRSAFGGNTSVRGFVDGVAAFFRSSPSAPWGGSGFVVDIFHLFILLTHFSPFWRIYFMSQTSHPNHVKNRSKKSRQHEKGKRRSENCLSSLVKNNWKKQLKQQ